MPDSYSFEPKSSAEKIQKLVYLIDEKISSPQKIDELFAEITADLKTRMTTMQASTQSIFPDRNHINDQAVNEVLKVVDASVSLMKAYKTRVIEAFENKIGTEILVSYRSFNQATKVFMSRMFIRFNPEEIDFERDFYNWLKQNGLIEISEKVRCQDGWKPVDYLRQHHFSNCPVEDYKPISHENYEAFFSTYHKVILERLILMYVPANEYRTDLHRAYYDRVTKIIGCGV